MHGPGPGPKKTVPKQLKHFQLNKHISQPLRGKISRTCVFQIITFFWLELKYDNSTCLLQAGRLTNENLECQEYISSK